jgi:Tfp pilus assembly protein FimV
VIDIVQTFVIQAFDSGTRDQESQMSAITANLPFAAGPRPVRRATATVAGPDTPLRLTRRGRVTVFVLALGVGLAGMLGNQVANAGTAAPGVPVETYTVRAGETLWDIALGVAGSGEDVRDVVDRLVILNDLPGAGLAAGQQILLPAEG